MEAVPELLGELMNGRPCYRHVNYVVQVIRDSKTDQDIDTTVLLTSRLIGALELVSAWKIMWQSWYNVPNYYLSMMLYAYKLY